ncbi:DUF1697 domain-containing protein [Kaistia dalseonensis]|uniref:Uncharacterized protein (DUF1697 family) n=1 Tax=Kaistia dalseonensis TaxID=410840 RepID=A0ABU0HDV1_9HYPH|nr:DUF1697 domain-containing protein [Kaistia dalseonensis]MCX5497279.1 DUF1697 domain-containing protein [Kaistia dalseonensis]MDQ0439915.1 uncharacterized protein (DUF1697 family) [Kaistia dalseonensis]
MTRAVPHIALLRAINVGGSGKVGMAELRALFEAQGFQDVATLLQTGNIVFTGPDAPDQDLEKKLEAAAREALGLDTDVLVRSGGEWAELIAANPFPQEAKDDPSHLIALLLKTAPEPDTIEALRAAIKGREPAELVGRTLYAAYPDGIGRSKLTTAVIERKLGTRATGRNWNTVLKIGAMVGA